MKITEVSIRKPVFAWMIMASFIFFGLFSFKQMGLSQLPDIDFPIVNINIIWEGAAPEVMELDVVDILEDALVSVEGLKNLSSNAKRGSANITAEFEIGRDIDVAVQDIQTKIGQAQRLLPRDIDPPVISKVNPEDRPIMWVAITNDQLSRRDLMTFVRDKVKDRFLSLEGVSDVILGGYIDPNLRVWLDGDKLREFELSSLDIMSAISLEHLELPGGLYESSDKEFTVRMLGESKTPEEFQDLIINRRGGSPVFQPIFLNQVARIDDDLNDMRRISRVNGLPSLGLGIRKIRGANSVDIADSVKQLIPTIEPLLPEGSTIGINFDNTIFIKKSIQELYYTLFHAALLTSFVCFLFLGSWGATLNIILSIPTAIIGSFIALQFFGFTLNTFTLLGLTLAVGLVVDDNIMILENIARFFKNTKDKLSASLQGTREVSFAALASAIAIIAIFLPIGFAKGIIGEYLFQFALTISVAVTFSLIDALSLTPMRASRMIKNEKMNGVGFINKFVEQSTLLYQKTLTLFTTRKITSLSLSVLLISISAGSAIYGIKNIGKEFTPAQDQSLLLIRLSAPRGSSLTYTDSQAKIVESILLKDPSVYRFFLAVGGFAGDQADSAMFFVTLKQIHEREINENNKPYGQMEIADQLRAKFKEQVTGAQVFIQDLSRSGFGGSRGYPIEFNIQGGNWDELETLANTMMEKMRESQLMEDVDSSYKGKVPEIHIIPDRKKAIEHGVSIEDLGRVIQAMVSGTIAGKFSKDGRRYDIRVKMEEFQLKDMEKIKNIQVRNNRGELISLKTIASIEQKEGLQLISRDNRLRSLTVFANMATGASQSDAMAKVNEIAQEVLPTGYSLSETGSTRTFSETTQSFMEVFLLGIVVAYMILAAQFNSFIQPLIILLALPFSITGAVLCLLIFGQSLNIYSVIGLILLMGIVKKNSIILVDYTNQLREQGQGIQEALQNACPTRFRPIIMTSISTVMGALPAALSTGAGSETRIPMALAVIGGVLVSTLLTLYIVPSFYYLTESLKK